MADRAQFETKSEAIVAALDELETRWHADRPPRGLHRGLGCLHLHPGDVALPRGLTSMTDVVLHFTVGPIEVGLWCNTHNLPGRYEVDLFMISDAGVSRVGTHSGCDCLRDE